MQQKGSVFSHQSPFYQQKPVLVSSNPDQRVESLACHMRLPCGRHVYAQVLLCGTPRRKVHSRVICSDYGAGWRRSFEHCLILTVPQAATQGSKRRVHPIQGSTVSQGPGPLVGAQHCLPMGNISNQRGIYRSECPVSAHPSTVSDIIGTELLQKIEINLGERLLV